MKRNNAISLFRFITLRFPELVDEQEKTIGFIEHYDLSDSHFAPALIGNSNIIQARSLVQQFAIDYSTNHSNLILKSFSEVKNIDFAVWEFSERLLKNKNILINEDEYNAQNISELDNSKKKRLWDNLFYDIARRNNRHIREACLQMLVASNYLKIVQSNILDDANIERLITKPRTPDGLSKSEKKSILLKRLANAAFIIPAAFSREKIDSKNLRKRIATSPAFRKKKYKKQKLRHEAELAKINCTALEEVRNEFVRHKHQYEKDYRKTYILKENEHNATIDTIEKTWINKNPETVQKLQQEFYNDPEFDIEDYVPDELTPPFEFEFPLPLSTEYIRGKLSQVAQDYILKFGWHDTSIDDAILQIDKMCRNERKTANRIIGRSATKAIVNGVPIERPSFELYDFTFSCSKIVRKPESRNKVINDLAFFLLLSLDYTEAFFRNANYQLIIHNKSGSNLILEDDNIEVINNNKEQLFVELFKGKRISLSVNSKFTIQGTFELNSGVKLRIQQEGIFSSNMTSGTAEVISDKEFEEPIYYEISNIGVADYRRVEQQLCCYIPGEVSHVENILAKEYKEKTTRSLMRTESVTDVNQEKEIEQSSDTSTTTRNELSTEVAEVINSDRASDYGFGAQAGGDYSKFHFSASVSGDFSSSRSTSDSNVEARNYAEDVTIRALEKVIQKTTIRRTSSIIREFEETNRHGFDNREGTNHVTGVYRWIDKVFKNRLINYGKKLICEFMIPEPARFYKLAIIIEAEENESNAPSNGGSTGNAGVNVKPKPLSEFRINSHKDINEDNYSTIASHYGVSGLQIPLDPSTSSSKSYSGGKNSMTFSDLVVKDGYEISALRFKGSVIKKKKGTITISSCGKSQKISSKGKNKEINASWSGMSGIEGNVSVAVSTHKVKSWSVSVTIDCTIKSDRHEQWQQDCYTAILDGYERKLREYNDALAAEEAAKAAEQVALDTEVNATQDKAESDRNPRFNAQIVNTELKRLCIELMTSRFNLPQGKNFYQEGTCNIPSLPSELDLTNYKHQVLFFEQAFDWNLMTKQFFSYFWADKCQWKELFQSTDSKDHMFQAFLQSGIAKVLIPIKEGYEAKVGFFMETGEIWNGTRLLIDTEGETYQSLIHEMNIIDGFVEEEWETIVPTSLTIVQEDSAGLNQGGLPCCDEELSAPYSENFEIKKDILKLPENNTE